MGFQNWGEGGEVPDLGKFPHFPVFLLITYLIPIVDFLIIVLAPLDLPGPWTQDRSSWNRNPGEILHQTVSKWSRKCIWPNHQYWIYSINYYTIVIGLTMTVEPSLTFIRCVGVKDQIMMTVIFFGFGIFCGLWRLIYKHPKNCNCCPVSLFIVMIVMFWGSKLSVIARLSQMSQVSFMAKRSQVSKIALWSCSLNAFVIVFVCVFVFLLVKMQCNV